MIIGDGMRIRDIRIAARPMTAVDMRITIGITAGVPFTMTIIGETTGMTQIDIGIVTTIVMTIGNQRNRISPNLKRIRRIGTIEKNGIIAMGERSNNSTIAWKRPIFLCWPIFSLYVPALCGQWPYSENRALFSRWIRYLWSSAGSSGKFIGI